MSIIHVSYTIRELEGIRGRLQATTEDQTGDSPLTRQEAADIVRNLLNLARFVELECQNSHVPRNRFIPFR